MLKTIIIFFLSSTLMSYTAQASDTIQLVTPISREQADDAIRLLAKQLAADYKNDDREQYLNQLFRLQMVAEDFEASKISIQNLRAIRSTTSVQPPLYLQYEIYAEAKILEARNSLPFSEAYKKTFRKILAQINDKAAHQAMFSFSGNLQFMKDDLDKAVQKNSGKSAITQADALELIRKYQVHQAFNSFMPMTDALIAENDAARYIIDKNFVITTPAGVHISAMMVRPRTPAAPQTSLLGFTIYADDDWAFIDAKKAASQGYAGIVAYTRGKGISTDQIVPYEHDGEDARAVIEWISHQAWSDGRVGMYGGSYNGFATWAATKHLPSALKAIMTSATAAPGIDIPMQGNVFQNFLYPWLPYVTNNKTLDDVSYNDQNHWDTLNKRWYSSGQAYRLMEKIDGKPSPYFTKWLAHPGYDAYWQNMIPYQQEFAHINIPVLQTTGYFDGAQVGALYYLNQHSRYNKNADHTLLIGPYEHLSMQTGVAREVQGYAIDAVANIDLQGLRFEWFDYIFKAGKKPELLKNKINYQVMGGNVWKHSASLKAMSNATIKFQLNPTPSKEGYRLTRSKIIKHKFVEQHVDFKDRRDVDWTAPMLSINSTLDAHNGITYVSDPLVEATELSGLFSGQLDFVLNKADFDFTITLYERSKEGNYFQLAYQVQRASYGNDRLKRKLLKPNKRQQINFMSERLTSRQMQPGSRLVIVLSINKQADQQINYGSGKDVSDESITDAQTALKIHWYGSSYVNIPIWKKP
ncbi:MAG: CocE/NonD family hydrolase [Undibacterium sp.]|nr:CocE/NonD family hydrolase [Undibacterium sp.]